MSNTKKEWKKFLGYDLAIQDQVFAFMPPNEFLSWPSIAQQRVIDQLSSTTKAALVEKLKSIYFSITFIILNALYSEDFLPHSARNKRPTQADQRSI